MEDIYQKVNEIILHNFWLKLTQQTYINFIYKDNERIQMLIK